MQCYAERLEHHARRAPDNWFNFYDFWAPPAQPPTPASPPRAALAAGQEPALAEPTSDEQTQRSNET